MQDETAARPEQIEEAENLFDEGFGLGEEDDGQSISPVKQDELHPENGIPQPEEPTQVDTPEMVSALPQVNPIPPYTPPPTPQLPPEPVPVSTVEVPDEIADELETLKTLNPDAAALALEDSPEGAIVRARLEQYGAELAQDRAEQVLYQRRQAQALREAETARFEQAREAHNAAFKAMFERDHPEYAAMLADPARKAEAARYQQEVFDWIAAKPYAEAAGLMQIAKSGRDPSQVSALLTAFERERRTGRKQPDPTGALAVPGRGAPVAPTGIGDKDDFDAGWNANQ
jgi:hypothetical protein